MIVDFHAHVGSFDAYGGKCQIDEMLKVMDLVGIDVACVFNIFHGRAADANNETARFVARHPERFIGFMFVNPHYPHEMEPEMFRAVDQLGFRGIKLYPPFYDRPISDPVWDPIFAFAAEHQLPIISHTDGVHRLVNPNRCEPQMFAPWAEKYPKVRLVLAHAGNFKSGRLSCIDMARRYDNVFVEICSSWRELNSIEELVEGAGEDRVLFGSDMPLMDPRIQMGRVLTARITEQARNKVLGENALRLLNTVKR